MARDWRCPCCGARRQRCRALCIQRRARIGKRCKFAARIGRLCAMHAKMTTNYPVRLTP